MDGVIIFPVPMDFLIMPLDILCEQVQLVDVEVE